MSNKNSEKAKKMGEARCQAHSFVLRLLSPLHASSPMLRSSETLVLCLLEERGI
jgi:hypothetical protein